MLSFFHLFALHHFLSIFWVSLYYKQVPSLFKRKTSNINFDKSLMYLMFLVIYFRNRLQVGLSTLSEANRMVGEMQEELVSLGPIIVAKAKVSSP